MKERTKTKTELENENVILRNIVKDTLWMARRYADGRATYAAPTVNIAVDRALGLGVEIKDDGSLKNPRYATDAMFGVVR